MDYAFQIADITYTITIDFAGLNSIIDSLIWEENKYCHLYDIGSNYISKEGFVHYIEGFKNLLTKIENNINDVGIYIEQIEKTIDGKLLNNYGYTIAIASGLSEIVPDASESWKTLELRIIATGDYTGEIKIVNRIKSKK